MYKIGITGSIGSGKSTIAKKFALFNVPIFNADEEIKKILDDKLIQKKIKETWPNIVKNNYINKPKLRSIIFSSKKEKTKLENIVYPPLKLIKKKFEQENYNRKIIVYDIPLIYETRSQRNFDLIILASCNINVQRRRVLKRDKISKTLFKKIIASQMSFEEKKSFNPKIINTNSLDLFILVKIIFLLIKIIYKIKIKNEK